MVTAIPSVLPVIGINLLDNRIISRSSTLEHPVTIDNQEGPWNHKTEVKVTTTVTNKTLMINFVERKVTICIKGTSITIIQHVNNSELLILSFT